MQERVKKSVQSLFQPQKGIQFCFLLVFIIIFLGLVFILIFQIQSLIPLVKIFKMTLHSINFIKVYILLIVKYTPILL
jgi:hypothetical protein